jgi:hypothetical protein
MLTTATISSFPFQSINAELIRFELVLHDDAVVIIRDEVGEMAWRNEVERRGGRTHPRNIISD